MIETIEGDCLIIRSHHCSAEFLRKMSKLREDGLYIDVRLKVLDKDIEHRQENVESRQQNVESRSENTECRPENIECRSENDECHQKTDEIEAHKLVLTCCSAYFEAMFSNKFAEGGNSIKFSMIYN